MGLDMFLNRRTKIYYSNYAMDNNTEAKKQHSNRVLGVARVLLERKPHVINNSTLDITIDEPIAYWRNVQDLDEFLKTEIAEESSDTMADSFDIDPERIRDIYEWADEKLNELISDSEISVKKFEKMVKKKDYSSEYIFRYLALKQTIEWMAEEMVFIYDHPDTDFTYRYISSY